MEDEEALQSRAHVGQASDSVQYLVYEFFAYSVVTSGVVVGGILLTSDHLLWMEQLSVCTSSDLIWKYEVEIIIKWYNILQWDTLMSIPQCIILEITDTQSMIA